MPSVGIVGAGLIGRSWAMVFARAGWDVRITPDGQRVVYSGTASGGSCNEADVYTVPIGGGSAPVFLGWVQAGSFFFNPVHFEISPDSARVVTAGDDGVRLWDTGSPLGRDLLRDEPADEVRFAPDGLSIAVLSRDHIHVYPDDLPTNTPALRAWIEQATRAPAPDHTP